MTADDREAAQLFIAVLEHHHWKVSLNAAGQLQVIVGADGQPRWPQAKIFAVLSALKPAIYAIVAARDGGLDGVGNGRGIH